MLEDPTFWTAVAFVIVVALLAKPIYKAVTSGLDGRADRIRSQLDEAQRLRDEAQELLADYQRKQREAQTEAERIIAQAKTAAERLTARAKLVRADFVQQIGEHWRRRAIEWNRLG